MENKILVVNPGSASKKYSFYSDGKEVFRAHFEIEDGGFVVTEKTDKGEDKKSISEFEYKKSAELVVGDLGKEGIIKVKEEINAVGFRTVAPGEYFLATRLIDSEFMDELVSAEDRAPLHVSSLTPEIKAISEILPEVPKYGVSDSTFYADRFLPSKYYGLPAALSEELQVYRYGYHGISAQSVSKKASAMLGGVPKNMVICHLGSGVSIIAVKDGKGFDASMGFTPLEGAIMSTRAGDIDSGALVYLMKRKGFYPDELNAFLNKKCGLLGLSETSDDMRELIRRESEGDVKAKNAIGVFVYRIKKQIGSFIAVLGGLDVLVFTATMGERSNVIRERVCNGMEDIGIKIDRSKNDATISGEGFISSDDSSVKVAVIKTDEMREIYEEVRSMNDE